MHVESCLFCKIVRGEIPAQIVARTDEAVAVRDISPQAPTHLLVIPTRHADNLGDFAETAPREELGELFAFAAQLGREAASGGYRVVANEGTEAGQTVFHLHIHVLAGRALGWPPG